MIENKHKIPKNITNSNLIHCIDEFVRLERDRNILKDKWFQGYSIERLAEKYKISETTVKSVIYDIGDEILLKVCDLLDE